MKVNNSTKILLLTVSFLSLFLQTKSFGQIVPPKPAVCTTPPAGYKLGGEFSRPLALCMEETDSTVNYPFTNVTVVETGQMNAVSFYVGLTDNIDITSASFKPTVASIQGASFKAQIPVRAGVHWVIQIGESGGQKYLACQTAEVIRKDPPVADIYTCNGTSVNMIIKDVSENQHNKYQVDWGDGVKEVIDINSSNPLPFDHEHQYTGNLSQVSLTGIYVRNGYDVCRTKPVIRNPDASVAPVITSLKTTDEGTGVEFGFKSFEPGKSYVVEYSEDNGSAYNWKSLGEAKDGTFQSTGLNKGSKYCFRMIVEDLCGNPVESNIVCGMSIAGTLSSSEDVSISWTLPSNPTGIPQQTLLERDIVGCDVCLTPLSLNSNVQTSTEDNSLECGKVYTYKVTTRYLITVNGQSEFVTIESEEIVIDPLDGTVKMIPNGVINAGYPTNDDAMIKLVVYDAQDVNNYTYFHKGPNDDDFLQIGTGQNSFEDIAIQPSSGSYCYKYQIEDACGIQSELSPQFCTVFLSYQGNTLNWTDYSFPDNVLTTGPAQYVVELYDENIGAFLPQYRTNNLTQAVGQLIYNAETPVLKFRIRAQQDLDIPGLTNFTFPSYSNTVTMTVPADIFVPTAFSPNGDGQNDTFEIKSKFLDSASITIFDRWGTVVYSGDIESKGWDGTIQGKVVPFGTYSYRIKGRSMAGDAFTKVGSLTLLK